MVVRVRKEEAQAILRQAIAEDLLDPRRKVTAQEEFVEIPLLGPLSGHEARQQDHPEFYREAPELSEMLKADLSSEEIDLLPRGWFILGQVIIVKIDSRLDRLCPRIARALLSMYPRCKTVLRDFGIEGQLRQPRREIIAGSITETVHVENGVRFKLDAARIMFSQGNLRERIRMSRLGRDETVVDMFAGIGYLSLPMAVHSNPRKILAIELNPVAFHYLQDSVQLNHVADRVRPLLGDCRDRTPVGLADRVIMGMVQVTDQYLQTGIRALRPGGMLHYHQTIPSRLYPARAIDDVVKAADEEGRKAEIIGCSRVKKYSPGVVHAVVDARIDK
ncbi:MAG: class I SAM-dependent methyltransferase family protein [Methanotrichaceae archaeon]|nr:class I SAM-dependent methyltransferase family protein [Methanotrichaceae archaeon]